MAAKVEEVELGIGDLVIMQNKDYFCFGIDSVLLANSVKGLKEDSVVVDLCTGSSVIPTIITAKNKISRAFGVELQTEMYELAVESVKKNKLNKKIQIIKEDIKNVKEIKRRMVDEGFPELVDVVTVNPPYKKEGTGVSSSNAVAAIARHEIKCTLEDVFESARRLLKDKGTLYMVHKPERLTDIICVARENKLEPKKIRFMQPKEGKKPSIVLFEFVKGGNSEVIVEPTLIEYNEDGSYTDEINEIYGLDRKDN